MKQIIELIKKEILLEWRLKYSFSGILIYVISTIFICYLSFKQIIDPPTWNALFWIILLFAAVNAVAKSFMQESKGLQLFYYTLLNPQHVILAKTIYNMILLLILSCMSFLFYILFMGNIVQNTPMFFIGLLLGASGLSSVLTLVSAIAAKTNNSSALMAILSFPILLPLLMTIIKFSKNAMDGLNWSVNYPNLIILLAINLLVISLSYLLFPYLWKE
ncbi:MAG TPA: heme exporter protein CcmB [Bacteroidia bacterium]|nr:heme exporter protein CcmB [Bacteroidia bacterium]